MTTATALKIAPMDESIKNDLIAMQKSGADRASQAQSTNNLTGAKLGHLTLWYRNQDTNQFLGFANAAIIAAAMQDAGLLKVSRRQDGSLIYQIVTKGEILPSRHMYPATQIEMLVREYCRINEIKPNGESTKTK